MASASSTEIEIGRYLIETDESKALFKGNYDVLLCLGKHVFTETTVVAKRYQVFKECPEEWIRSHEHEAHLMKAIPPHENIVQIFDFMTTDGLSTDGEDVSHLWLVMEYCPLGDLKKFAGKAAPLSFSQKLDLMIQSAKGVQHLHLNNMVHRDLKPPNLLVTGEASKPIIKVADFGESKQVVATMHTGSRGTDTFKAPEILLDSNPSYNKSVDIFSLGCTYLSLVNHKKPKQAMIPFVEGKVVGRYVRNHPGEDLAAHIIKEEDSAEEAELKRFLALMMSNDPSARPSIQQVIDTLTHLLAASDTAVRGADGKRSSHVSDIKTINRQKAKITLAGSTAMSVETSRLVSFDSCGEVLVNDVSHLSLYRHEGTTSTSSSSSSSSSTASSSSSSHILAEKIRLPKGVLHNCFKAVIGDALYVQNLTRGDAPTHKFSIANRTRYTLHHSGMLCGATDEGLVYGVKRSYEDYIIHIHRPSGAVILKPPSGMNWKYGLSVCCTDHFFVVVECINRCLDVFTCKGEHVKHVDLRYHPHDYCGVSPFNHNHVMVANDDLPELHVYRIPELEHVKTISREEMGLEKDELVKGVIYSNNGWITVAVAKYPCIYIHSLRTYKVSIE